MRTENWFSVSYGADLYSFHKEVVGFFFLARTCFWWCGRLIFKLGKSVAMFWIPKWLADYDNLSEQQWKQFTALDGDFYLLTHTFKVKTAVCHPTRGLFTFHLPCIWPGRVCFLLPSTNAIDVKDRDVWWRTFPTGNERAGTVDHLAREAQIAADGRRNGSLIASLCSSVENLHKHGKVSVWATHLEVSCCRARNAFDVSTVLSCSFRSQRLLPAQGQVYFSLTLAKWKLLQNLKWVRCLADYICEV